MIESCTVVWPSLLYDTILEISNVALHQGDLLCVGVPDESCKSLPFILSTA
jgi:hypothetical protein